MLALLIASFSIILGLSRSPVRLMLALSCPPISRISGKDQNFENLSRGMLTNYSLPSWFFFPI